MIKVEKSNNPPGILTKDGAKERGANNDLYDSDPAAYKTGEKKFEIKSSIYGHESVKAQLINEQAGKCCFCESDFTATGYGDVEHFRPKSGYQQNKKDKLKKPGYYWKAYDWDNLFFSCKICNEGYKKNYFPLEDDSRRAVCHHDDINKEQPLLIHPSLDDPERHIGFREEVPYPKDDKGKKSIEAFGLNREKLNDKRREYLRFMECNYIFSKIELDNLSTEAKKKILKMMKMSEQEAIDLVAKACDFINKAAKSTSQFAAMIRAKYPNLPR